MSAFATLLALELGILAVVTAAGSHLALALGLRDRGVALALAPSIGFAVLACAGLWAALVLPGRVAAWVVVAPLALLGALGAARRVRTGRGAGLWPVLPAATAAALALTVLVPLAAYDAPLAGRDSVGPLVYQTADASYYVPAAHGLNGNAITDDPWGPPSDITASKTRLALNTGIQAGTPVLEAQLSSLLRVPSADIDAALLIALIAAGGLGVWGATRQLGGSTLGATAAGLATGAGPVAYSLFLESSDSALGAAALIPLVLVAAVIAVSRRTTVGLVVLGGALAATQVMHPAFAVPLGGWGAAAVLVLLARGARSAAGLRASVVAAARPAAILAGTFLVASGLQLLSTERFLFDVILPVDLHPFGKGLAEHLDPLTAAPYLLGVREIYTLPGLTGSPWLVLSALLTPALLLVAIVGLRGRPWAWLFWSAAAGCSAIAVVVWAPDNCLYCAQRGLLPLASLVWIAAGIGIARCLDARGRVPSPAVFAVVAISALVIGHATWVGTRRVHEGAHVVTRGFTDLAERAGRGPDPLYLEALDAFQFPLRDATIHYTAAQEHAGRAIALDQHATETGALLWPRADLRRVAVRDWTWVLTRAGGVRTGRTVIARSGTFALERRTAALDVAIDAGIRLDMAVGGPVSTAWVTAPLRFVVSAHAAVPALLRLTFGGPAAATSSPATPGAKVLRRGPGTLIVCLPVAGLGPLRTADLAVAVSGPQAAPPRHRSSYLVDVALPQALSLVAMAAEPGIC